MFSATAILYVAEISSPKSRGLVAAIVILFGYIGVFAVNLSGAFFDITIFLSVMPCFPLIFLVTLYLWMIESPFYLFQQGSVLKAKISLKNLRDCKSALEVDNEFKSMEAFFNMSFLKNPGQLFLEFVCPKGLRLLALSVPVLCIFQMLGVTAMNDYALQLIDTSYPKVGHITTSFIDIVTGIVCLFVIDRFGRKPLLILSTIGSALICLIFSIYILMYEEGCKTKTIHEGILPVTMLGIYYSIYALGLTPVLPIITGEIFPCQAKTVAVSICSSLLYLTAFCIQRSYNILNANTNSCLAFACFTMLGSLGMPFAIGFLPETKGKSLLQIQNDFANIFMTSD